MRAAAVAVLGAIVLTPVQVMAQGKSVEIGTNAGLTIFTGGGATTWDLAAPGAGIGGAANVYASFFGAKEIFIEPSAGLAILHGGGNMITNLSLAGTVGYLLKKSAAVKGTYLAADVALDYAHLPGNSATDYALGAKVGYRVPVGSSFAVRLEGGYRKWLHGAGSFGTQSEITFGVGLGGVIHRAASGSAPSRRR